MLYTQIFFYLRLERKTNQTKTTMHLMSDKHESMWIKYIELREFLLF